MVALKQVKFPDSKTSFMSPSWEEMGKLAFELGKKILTSKRQFDRLITLAKGGWAWSRTLSDYLNIENIASIQIKFYTDVNRTQEKSTIIQSLPLTIDKEKILLFDDISDTGESLNIAKQYLSMCGTRKITTATLFCKPWTKCTPDFYQVKTKAWVIFPDEIRETIESLSQNWYKEKLSKGEIIKRLINIGLPKEQVKYFIKSN